MYQEPALMLDLSEDGGPSSFITPLDAWWRGSFIPFENQRQSYVDPLNYAPPPQLFSNSSPLHHCASSSSSRINDEALGTGSWVVDGANELLYPSYGNQSSSVWVNRPQITQYGNGDRDLARSASSTATTQALSLSLSSNPPPPELRPVTQFQEGFRQESLRVPDEVPVYAKFSVPSSRDPRCSGLGPLGPFTGYAAILKNSKFLKPAQQLLDEFCSVVIGSEFSRSSEGESNNCNGMLLSGASSAAMYTTSADTGHGEVSGSSGGAASKTRLPEFQQRKTKLLYMQEEVCRRYKQYHQQMQMVVSSFESVAGLSGATPYTSLALKGVSKHFRSLKKAISDQLCHCIKALREELMSSSPGSSYKGGENAVKHIDKTLRKQKAAAELGLNFFDRSQQPVWRPQRGLPERAVSVLRAWLFDHFLHPYPTDTDKHMLATQTGLSRNQVSNWFINARVRLWKPMVEEIHMLETKGGTGMDLNFSKENEALMGGALEGHHHSDEMLEALSSKQPMDCSPVLDEESSRALEQWHREKRSRLDDCGIDGGLLSFATAYQQVGGGGMDIEGLDVVSLTLGLQHDDGSKRGPHQKTMMSPRFGTHLLHDFVG